MKVTIDRFEGKFAVCETEDLAIINIEINKLPSGAKAGDILNISQNDISIDEISSEKQKDDINKLMEDVWE